MFGIKKLKRRISELDTSRTEWMKIAKTGIEEIKTLKEENAKLKLDDERWRTQTESLVKEIESRDNEIKSLEARNKEFDDSIRSGMVQERCLKDSIKTIKEENDKLKSAVEDKDNTIKTLEREVERLTRKRDAKGRFVKSVPIKHGFEVGDKVRIKEGICFETVTDKSITYSPSMDEHIGEIGEITTVGVGIIRVQFANNWWHFQPDWLEHAE